MFCPIRQPSSLKEVSLNGLKNFYGDFLSLLSENNRRHTNDFWQNEAPQWFGEQILDGVPHSLADEVFAALLEVWLEARFHVIFDDQFIISVLSNSIKSVLLKLNVRKISLEQRKYIVIAPILNWLHSMPQLQHLCLLNLQNCTDDCISEKKMLKVLECLPNLKVFRFDRCTDEMLWVLSRNCLVLERVALYFNYETLSSKSVLGLADCKRLRCITLRKCVLPAEAFASLITGLSSLQEVNVIYMDEVLDVIEKKQLTCFLKRISCGIQLKHLKTVNALCPQVHKLVLNIDRTEDLNVRYKLQNLEEVSLTSFNYNDIKVLPSILEMANLKCVAFCGGKIETEDALCIVANNCVNLETLILDRITVMRCERTIECLALAFLQVDELYDSHKFLIHVRCPRLKSVVVNQYAPRDTELIEKFLRVNGKCHFRKESSRNGYWYTTIYRPERLL